MKTALLAFLGIAVTSTVHAQDLAGPYMGFALGSLDYEERDETLGATFSDSATAYRILGGYRFTDNFALEGGWGSTSDLEDSFRVGAFPLTVTADYEVLTVRALGLLPLGGVTLLGGVGAYDAELNATASLPGFSPESIDDSDSGATLVGGLQGELERVTIRGEIEWFDTDSSIDAMALSVGVLFRF